jgi:hypothetical protein
MQYLMQEKKNRPAATNGIEQYLLCKKKSLNGKAGFLFQLQRRP